MKPIKSRFLLIALAASFLVVGTVGCGGPKTSESGPTDAGVVETTANLESAEGETPDQAPIDGELLQTQLGEERISAEIGAIASAYTTYADSIQNNLLAPLDDIANQAEADRTIAFIEETGLNVDQVNTDRSTLNAAVKDALGAVNEIKSNRETEGSDVAQLSLLAQKLLDLDADVEAVNRVVLESLTLESGIKAGNIFVSPGVDSDADEITAEQRQVAISNLQRTLPNFVGETIGEPDVGSYGVATSGGVRSFVETQNERIAEQIETIVSAVPAVPEPDERKPINWLALTTLLFAILNTLAIAWIFLLFQKMRKQQNQLAKTLSSSGLKGQTTALDSTQMEIALQDLQQQVSEHRQSQIALSNSVQNIHNALTTNATPMPRATQTASSPTRHASVPMQEQTQEPRMSRSASGHRTKQDHQDYDALPVIATVKMSQKSQEEIWVGEGVAPVFSESNRGDYCIVSSDNQRYYIILKDKALINANNLKTLKILYDFVDQAKLSTLKRKYETPAEVRPLGGNEWELLRPGKLTFYSSH
jgi:hypothetical protein